jgi:hypothetical protein
VFLSNHQIGITERLVHFRRRRHFSCSHIASVNQKLARQLSAGLSSVMAPGAETPVMTIPIGPGKVGELFALIAKGLVWHHWQVLLPPDDFGVRAEMLSIAGERFYIRRGQSIPERA